MIQSSTTQLQSHQQPKSTCSQLKNAFVGFQQTPKRQGQQTMGRLLPACSAFTNPPSSLSYCQQLDNYQSRGNSNYAIFYTPPLTGGKVRWLLQPRDIQLHVGFQQTPKRQGQQTMGRLFPACSAFTNPPSSSELRTATNGNSKPKGLLQRKCVYTFATH